MFNRSKEKKKSLLDEAILEAVEANNLKAFKSLSEMKEEEDERARLQYSRGFFWGVTSAVTGSVVGTIAGRYFVKRMIRNSSSESE